MSARLHAVSDGTKPAVEVARLRKTYPGGIEAVRGIDFQVAPGEVFGLLGPNGAGKSTTIGMLTTTIKPTSGSARLAGFDVARDPVGQQRRLPGTRRGQGADRPPQPRTARAPVGNPPLSRGPPNQRTGRLFRAVRGDRPYRGQL